MYWHEIHQFSSYSFYCQTKTLHDQSGSPPLRRRSASLGTYWRQWPTWARPVNVAPRPHRQASSSLCNPTATPQGDSHDSLGVLQHAGLWSKSGHRARPVQRAGPPAGRGYIAGEHQAAKGHTCTHRHRQRQTLRSTSTPRGRKPTCPGPMRASRFCPGPQSGT